VNYPTQQYQPQAPSANDALMGGGASHPSVQFVNPGDGVQGAVVISFESRQERAYADPRPDGTQVPYNERRLLFFPSGDPIYGVVVTVQTSLRTTPEDDGVRALFVEGKGKKATLRDAIKAAGATGLEVGGVIDFMFTHSENPADPKARKHYAARYARPGQASANAALGAPAVQPAYAAAPPAPASPWAPSVAPAQVPTAAPVAPVTAVPPWVTQQA